MTTAATSARIGVWLGKAGLALATIVIWSLAFMETAEGVKLALFALAGFCVVAAFGRRLVWPAVTVIGVLALTFNDPESPRLSLWGVVFLVFGTAGAWMSLRPRRAMRWVAAAVPFWLMSYVSDWFALAGAVCLVLSVVMVATGLMLPGRLKPRKAGRLDWLASGPVAPVTPAVYPTARPKRALYVAAGVFGVAAVAMAAAAVAGIEPDFTGALAIPMAVLGVTLAFSNWFSERVQVRIDERGVYGRVFFREYDVPWTEVAGLSMKLVYFGFGGRIAYYCVYSPTHEVSFPATMPRAAELRATIEAATGLQWSDPPFQSNL